MHRRHRTDCRATCGALRGIGMRVISVAMLQVRTDFEIQPLARNCGNRQVSAELLIVLVRLSAQTRHLIDEGVISAAKSGGTLSISRADPWSMRKRSSAVFAMAALRGAGLDAFETLALTCRQPARHSDAEAPRYGPQTRSTAATALLHRVEPTAVIFNSFRRSAVAHEGPSSSRST